MADFYGQRDERAGIGKTDLRLSSPHFETLDSQPIDVGRT